MRFNDLGIIISARKYSENAFIVKLLSQNHGLYFGFIKISSSSKKQQGLCQNFNLVDFEWNSKSEDALGYLKLELKKSFLSHIIASPIKLAALNFILVVIEENISERDPNESLFESLLELLENLEKDDKIFLKEYIKFEIKLLEILGYGLDLSCCAGTGETEDLHFVSPKSARAVSRKIGEKYKDKLLILPKFLIEDNDEVQKNDLLNGLNLSGFFLDKNLSESSIYKDKSHIRTSRLRIVEFLLKENFS